MKSKFYIKVSDLLELIVSPEGTLEAGVFLKPYQLKTGKILDGLVNRGGKKKDLAEPDVNELIAFTKTLWEIGSTSAKFIKITYDREGIMKADKIPVTGENLEILMLGLT